MSRIGNNPITIPSGVEVNVQDGTVTVKGKLGELTQAYDTVNVEVADGEIRVTRTADKKEDKAKHGLYRALFANMVAGVTDGFTKQLELVGVG